MRGKTTIKYLQDYLNSKDSWKEQKYSYMLKLIEEVGELAVAIRNNKLYEKTGEIKGSIDEEIWDVIYYAIAIANCYDIDLENVIKIKEDINNKRYNPDIVFLQNN